MANGNSMLSAPNPISISRPLTLTLVGSIKKPFPPYTSTSLDSSSTLTMAVNASIEFMSLFAGPLTSFIFPLLNICFTTKLTSPVLYNALCVRGKRLSGGSSSVSPVAMLIYSVVSVARKFRLESESEIFTSDCVFSLLRLKITPPKSKVSLSFRYKLVLPLSGLEITSQIMGFPPASSTMDSAAFTKYFSILISTFLSPSEKPSSYFITADGVLNTLFFAKN